MSARRLIPWAILTPLMAAAMDGALRDNLLKRPPFGVVARPASPTAAGVAVGATELRGIFGSGANCQVSLRRGGATGESKWLKVGESSGPWRVISANLAAREAVVEVDGRAQTLALAKSDAQPLAVVAVTVAAEPPGQAGATSPPAVSPSPAPMVAPAMAPPSPAGVPEPPATPGGAAAVPEIRRRKIR